MIAFRKQAYFLPCFREHVVSCVLLLLEKGRKGNTTAGDAVFLYSLSSIRSWWNCSVWRFLPGHFCGCRTFRIPDEQGFDILLNAKNIE